MKFNACHQLFRYLLLFKALFYMFNIQLNGPAFNDNYNVSKKLVGGTHAYALYEIFDKEQSIVLYY